MSWPNTNAGSFKGVANSNQVAPSMRRMVPETIPMTGKEAMTAPLSMSESLA